MKDYSLINEVSSFGADDNFPPYLFYFKREKILLEKWSAEVIITNIIATLSYYLNC
eukprot:c3424_g1_i1 orf=140-307(-)